MKDDKQESLFENPPAWTEHWGGMPEYNHQDLEPWKTVLVNFRNRAERDDFASLIGQTVTDKTRSIWYPKADIERYVDKKFKGDLGLGMRYPVFVISKGRWESRKTVLALESMGVRFHIVVEPQEYDNYAAVIDPAKILTLPFSNLGQGSIPARNWVWEFSRERGAERHWILDDNIRSFHRFENNLKVPVGDASTFRALEDFTDRFDNVAMSGMNYFMFATRKSANIPPYVINTRIYSCILIRNDIQYRWRGRYNEDTDLSIRALKDGWCTILSNQFLAYKEPTMTMKGGNTDEMYKDDGRKLMAKSLVEQHPDITRVTWKFNRWQHQVDYSGFKKNKLRLKPGVVIPEGSDNYGMELHVDKGEL